MDAAALSAAFSRASLDFHVKADGSCVEIIGIARTLFMHRAKLSAVSVEIDMESLRKAMIELNAAFTKLDLAHAAMTVGETASKIRAAAEG